MAKSNVIQKPSKILFDRALGAIKLDKQIKADTAILDADKEWLRQNGPLGQTLDIPGHGSVQFKSGAAAKPGGEIIRTYTFNLAKFKEMTPTQQKKLYDLGLVSYQDVTTQPTPAGTPAICFVHNT